MSTHIHSLTLRTTWPAHSQDGSGAVYALAVPNEATGRWMLKFGHSVDHLRRLRQHRTNCKGQQFHLLLAYRVPVRIYFERVVHDFFDFQHHAWQGAVYCSFCAPLEPALEDPQSAAAPENSSLPAETSEAGPVQTSFLHNHPISLASITNLSILPPSTFTKTLRNLIPRDCEEGVRGGVEQACGSFQLWPAIWMLPVDSKYGPWPASGEIDLVESRGNGLKYTNRGANYVQGSLNWGPIPVLNSVGKSYSWWTEKRKIFSSDFHTYTMEWTDKWIRISVDTRLHTLLDLQFKEPFFKRGDYPPTAIDTNGHPVPVTNPWVNGTNATLFDQDFYLIMNVAVGGTNGWFPDGQGDKPWLNHAGKPMSDFINNKQQWLPTWPENLEERALAVDYVRMWKHCGDP
ncbi:Glucan 1,3-beta-glucosidase [Mycena indigotica]|uniref:Glucan 1,3-beta-glucosidase n=1 Tax=Mycena indigotica TaxID=2126181 RepID=A0A8H6S910_9AGAR|nr:Glucan 1,3-beta-glucosidase [Mycena indigotica]KAF7293515.1 Glucan 1,3-beta-glucosidase [Mycena indigotica]